MEVSLSIIFPNLSLSYSLIGNMHKTLYIKINRHLHKIVLKKQIFLKILNAL